jgi:hypothetical protein
VPAATPETIPDEPTVATEAALLLHVPPDVASLKDMTEPAHTEDEPEMAAGTVLTVTVAVAVQPDADVYVTIDVPVATPLTMPVALPIVATPMLLLLHAPPLVASVSVVAEPTHTPVAPDTDAGDAITDVTAVAEQPVPSVYVITVVPAAIPLTAPVPEPMAAADGLLQLHVPPAVVLRNVTMAPVQTLELPAIAPGSGFTVAIFVTVQLALIA